MEWVVVLDVIGVVLGGGAGLVVDDNLDDVVVLGLIPAAIARLASAASSRRMLGSRRSNSAR